MEKLPFDMKMKLMQELTGKEILNVSSASTVMKKITEENKYDSLWKKKIWEEFGLKYSGKHPVEQYTFLLKLHSTEFYIVTTDYEEDDDSSFDALFVSYELAKEFVIKEVIRRALDFGEILTYNQVMYKMGTRGDISYNSETRSIIKIEVMTLKSDTTQKDRFFHERESLYRTLFGQDSFGESLTLHSLGPQKKKAVVTTAVSKELSQVSKDINNAKKFFRILDNTIERYYNFNDFNKEMTPTLKNFKEWNFSEEHKKLLFDYIVNNAFLPREVPREVESEPNEGELNGEDYEEEEEEPVLIDLEPNENLDVW